MLVRDPSVGAHSVGFPELGGPEVGPPILELSHQVLAKKKYTEPSAKLFRE